MAFGLAEKPNTHPETRLSGLGLSIRAWQRRAASLKRNIGYVEQHAIHHFHGSKSRRGYGDRWRILVDHAFDPHADLSRDWQGLWQLTPDKPGLRDAIRNYFASRNEDDLSLSGPRERPMT